MSSATCRQPYSSFDEAMERIKAVTNTSTQAALAEKLGIRQSSISDAKRRGSIPDRWLVVLVTGYSINPIWIWRGTGGKYLVPRGEAPLPPDFENLLKNAPAGMLLRVLAVRMNRPDIQVIETGGEAA